MTLEWPRDQIERFSVYGFSIDYPLVCRIEFKPKNSRGKGDMVFHFPDKEKLFVSWGDLTVAQKNFQTLEGQVEHNMQSLRKRSKRLNVQNLARTTDSLTVSSHRTIFNNIRLEERGPGLFRRSNVSRSAYTVHLHCPNSNRFFVIYTLLSPKAPEDFENLFKKMASSLKCHQA